MCTMYNDLLQGKKDLLRPLKEPVAKRPPARTLRLSERRLPCAERVRLKEFGAGIVEQFQRVLLGQPCTLNQRRGHITLNWLRVGALPPTPTGGAAAQPPDPAPPA